MVQTVLVGKILAGLAAVAVLLTGLQAMLVQDLSLGSVGVGSEYYATTTAENNINGEITSGEVVLKTGQGSLGSVVLSGTATGVVSFYNATTSDEVNGNDARGATSSIFLGEIAPSASETTYTFDTFFTDGLLLVVSGTAPSTTVTYR